jgi:hypothetical protein
VDNSLIELFFAETTKAFHFLESEYGYRYLGQKIIYPDEGRDTRAIVNYAGSRVGVQIGWGFADGIIGIYFIELLEPYTFPTSISYYPFEDRPDTAKGIRLYTLAEMLDYSDDPNFLLKNVENFRTSNRRMKTIETRMPEVIAGLALASQTYATPILQGDTSIFPRVMNAYVTKLQTLYPSRHFFFYNLEEPS